MIRYLTSENSGGDYKLRIDDSYEFGYSVNSGQPGLPVEQEIAELTIGPGVHVITLQPLEIRNVELLKLLEVQLIPIED